MSDQQSVNGYVIPVYRSCTQPLMTAGVPRAIAIIIWTFAAALGLGAQQLWVVPIAMVVHFALAGVARHDPYFFDVVKRAIKQKQRYEP